MAMERDITIPEYHMIWSFPENSPFPYHKGPGCELNVNSIIKKGQNREFSNLSILAVNTNKSKYYETNQKVLTPF